MNKVNITARRNTQFYEIPIILGETVFGIKLDTGAKYTVISVGMLNDDLSEEKLERIKVFCETHNPRKEKFISASGHIFWGYYVTAHHVLMDTTILQDFHYFLIIENKRDIALLGFDFIDNFTSSHSAHSNITITEFDEVNYRNSNSGTISNDDIIAFIDSLSTDAN